MKYIYHHLGLGDHIINNGMVRHFHKTYGELSLFAKNHYLENVKYMYRDLKSFSVIGIETDEEANEMISRGNLDCIKIGFEALRNCGSKTPFDKAFYMIAGLDFSIRFKGFHLERDIKKEQEVLNTLNPTGEPYIFIHDDASRGFTINPKKIKSQKKFIMNDKRFYVFDYITTLQNADEIHFMQSAFKELICSFELKKPKLYQHNYVRKYESDMNSSGINKIKEIK